MTTSVTQHRHELCDMLAGLSSEQWSAETLCAGWDAGDIAAHLIVREREPWAAPGIVLGGPFARITDARQRAWKARGRGALLATLRSGPPGLITAGPLGEMQLVEDWIHEQDVRRGDADVPSAEPEPELARVLWRAARRFAARTLAVDGNVAIGLTDGERVHVLRARPRWPLAATTTDEPDVVVTGAPGELLLYAVGRDGAQVTVSGDPAAQAILAGASRSI